MKQLIGKTIYRIEKLPDENGLAFYVMDTWHFQLFHLIHEQNCCEDVFLEDICGDLDDLLNTPIILSEEFFQCTDPKKQDEATYSFYRMGTNRGEVTIRFFGESNGCYSESADLILIKQWR